MLQRNTKREFVITAMNDQWTNDYVVNLGRSSADSVILNLSLDGQESTLGTVFPLKNENLLK